MKVTISKYTRKIRINNLIIFRVNEKYTMYQNEKGRILENISEIKMLYKFES